MAHEELFDCSICLQLFDDPVTTACGHSFCMKCINTFWDRNNERDTYSCPQCRQTFNPRPVLKRNTLLADLFEEHKRTKSQNAAAGETFASPDDVQCDACTGRKKKATMNCLVCLASYCETHLQPHSEVPPLKKHKLVPASTPIKESICGYHGKLLESYCRTDQQFICLLCAMNDHKGHDTVTVEAEKCEMQRKLETTKQEIEDKVLASERQMTELRQAADCIRDAAWEVCDDFERLCQEHIRLYVRSVERRCSEMREKVGEAEKSGVDWTSSLHGQLRRHVSELRGREDKLDQLSLTKYPIKFLQGFQALGDLPVFTVSHERFHTLSEFVIAQKDTLKDVSDQMKKDLFNKFEENLVSNTPRHHEETPLRSHFLSSYSRVEVDPNTIAACLCLSDGNREISWSGSDQAHPDHTDRFTYHNQALCKDGLTGRHYWEVEWDVGIVEVAVAYKHIQRRGSGKECCFGHNNLSWKLVCSPSGCEFWHNNLRKGQIPVAQSRKVGVHLDYEAGNLGFYSISGFGDLTLLHQVKTTFTEPLYPGFSVDLGSTLKICNI
ncbi:E3 ubiquitin/ISG15 ligase TRIM25-like [Scomber scombrus]|uniref:E3 ubiquitin/ISG15 ligase TRIM25-like n=1 Tax=Scomber scombrus TaxID=13677 RepID=UPI002DDBD0F8|nr:E3 ubiquitin/ISG15 ligase TRIM25-like [Scomber scombrus]